MPTVFEKGVEVRVRLEGAEPLPYERLTAHRELRGTPRLKIVFDALAKALA
mgnify:CR=1 FL=1